MDNSIKAKGVKLTKRQKEIIKKVQDGWILFNGVSESTGRIYYGITKGFDNIYFNATVWYNLLEKKLIYQEVRRPYDYHLTELGESI